MDRESSGEKRGLVIAAFPKSASIHVVSLVEKAAVGPRVVRGKICNGFGHNFLNPALIPRDPDAHVVAYGHVPASAHNLDVIRRRLVDPSCVVLLRSLPDAVVSLADHIMSSRRSPLDYEVPGLVDGFPHTLTCSRAQLHDLVIAFTLPWYIRFVCSWVHGRHGIPMTVSTFEEHTQYPAEAVRCVLAFAEVASDESRIAALGQPGGVEPANFNKGVGGRGSRELTDEQRGRIAELVSSIDGLRGTALGRYLVSGYAGLEFTASDSLRWKVRRRGEPELLLADQPVGLSEGS